MKRLLFAAALSCAFCLPASASTSNVTATLADSDGTAWGNCTWTAIVNSSLPPTIAGVAVPDAQLRANGSCSASGALTATMLDTSSVQQSGVTWTFTIQPNASVLPSVVSGVAVTGATINLSTALSSGLTKPRFGAGPNAYGYADVEINSSSIGNTYFNTGTVCSATGGMRQLSLAGWQCGTSSGGGGGNTTSNALTPNFFPKSNGTTSIVNGSMSDDGTKVATPEPLVLTGANNMGLDLTWTGVPSLNPPAHTVQFTVDQDVPVPYKIPVPVTLPTTTNKYMNCSQDPCVWDAGNSSGGAGAMVQIAQVVVTSAVPTITFSTIPGTFTNLKLVVRVASSNSIADNLFIRYNTDTAADYSATFCSTVLATCFGGNGIAPPATEWCSVPGVNDPNYFGSCVAEVLSYASTVGFKSMNAVWSRHDPTMVSGDSPLNGTAAVDWAGTPAPITALVLGMNTGSNFIVGSVATLYGEQ